MQHHVNALNGSAHPVVVADITVKHIDPFQQLPWKRVKPSPGVERVVIHKGPHRTPGVQEPLDEMAADEAVSAGDEN